MYTKNIWKNYIDKNNPGTFITADKMNNIEDGIEQSHSSLDSHIANHPEGIQGPKGDTGPQGVQGPKGDIGPQGARGEIGLQGPQGSQGLKGDKGATGAQGPKGDTGIQGLTGPQGPKGDTGPKGEKGEYGGRIVLEAIISVPNGDGYTPPIQYDKDILFLEVFDITHGVLLFEDINFYYNSSGYFVFPTYATLENVVYKIVIRERV